MMYSFLLKQAAVLMVPLQAIFSVFLLLRGHNDPGGGFIGGLIAAAAVLLHGIARGPAAARRIMYFDPRTYIGAGVLLAVISGFPALFTLHPYLTGVWGGAVPMIVLGKIQIGTPLFFDIGVYLTVIGVVTLLAFSLEEAD